MVLQAKAVVSAESLTLVLTPDFQFTEEIRPIVAEELAKQATPRAAMDRAWGELVDWILLGEGGIGGEPPSADEPGEAAFRQEAIQAIADVWIDDVDALFQELQTDIPQYTSADYWQEHPENYVFLETALGFLRMFASQLNRLEERTDLEKRESPSSLEDIDVPDDVEDKLLTEELMRMIEAIQSDTQRYSKPAFWDQNYESRSALISSLTALRLLLARVNQSVDARYAQSPHELPDREVGTDDSIV